ncbi:hypothetical protein DH2020_045324 [Rehmannia glutinosa]|uniref:Uncharacterized protein n=1 Tax=Rehmannia glutinosa TaxID=99300 RepID=A0ABR0UF70_REHGL
MIDEVKASIRYRRRRFMPMGRFGKRIQSLWRDGTSLGSPTQVMGEYAAGKKLWWRRDYKNWVVVSESDALNLKFLASFLR